MNVDLIRELEKENEMLRDDIIDLRYKIESLRDEKNEIECELEHHVNNFNSDEEVIEHIHLFYYEVCDRIDNNKPVDLESLNKFFRLTIDKRV